MPCWKLQVKVNSLNSRLKLASLFFDLLEPRGRECPTPNRTSEHVLFLVLTAGSNCEFGGTGKKWHGWTGDASTAFLQGEQPADERTLPLYIRPPDDGVTRSTNCWKAPLYLVLTNIYGLANAPRLWANTVIQRLKKLGYRQHSFDRMVFLLFNEQDELISIILVYVDDFLAVHREDCPIQPVWDSFKWGSLNKVEANKEFTFKGKQISLRQRPTGRFYLHLCQAEFIDGMSVGKIPRGANLEETLSPEQRAEFRSISGCLQWLSTQTRPELSATNSLSNKGEKTTLGDLKALYQALEFARATKNDGIVLEDVALNRGSTIVTYSDASWANAEQCRSQLGVLVLLTSPTVLQRTTPAAVLDWRSGRSTRVCRSTLAAEASAADEGCDRGCYLNMFVAELLYNIPAHRCPHRLLHLHVVDAKSLYDVVVSDTPNLADKRSLVNIRAIQEVVDSERIRWVPTHVQWADGLTKHSTDLQVALHSWLQKPVIILRDDA